MALSARRTTVGTTRVRLTSTVDRDYKSGSSFLVRNRGTISVFLGGSTVTPEDGFELEANAVLTIDLATSSDVLYAVTEVETSECHTLQVGI